MVRGGLSQRYAAQGVSEKKSVDNELWEGKRKKSYYTQRAG